MDIEQYSKHCWIKFNIRFGSGLLKTSYLILCSVAIFGTSNIVDKSLLKRDTVLMSRDIDPPICSYDRANKLHSLNIE